MDYENPKKSDLEPGRTYFVCPDPQCRLFYEIYKGGTACEKDCPKQGQLVKIIVCDDCGEMVELPGNHEYGQGTGHSCEENKPLVRKFKLRRYVRLNKKPL
jgi:hypothetical protein